MVQEKIKRALEKSGSPSRQVKIMACTKTFPKEKVREVIEAGILLIGENRVQEARAKALEGAYEGACLCLIGHLQTNKASLATRIFDEIHSIDSLKLAQLVSKFAIMYRKAELPVMIEVNIGEDPKKSGCAPSEALALAREIISLPGLSLKGLMTVAPGYGDPVQARKAFEGLRLLRDQMVSQGIPFSNLAELSMGMSSDYEIAVEEGATMVRLGTELLGPRPGRQDI